MMRSVTVITDSIGCLTPEIVERYQMQVLPINLYFGDRAYKDWVDITPTEAYKVFMKDPKRFTTSAPSPFDCLEAFREASKQTRDILCVTVSAKLSMVYESARLAREQAQSELPGTNIEIIDSYSATASQGFVALAVARAAADGKGLSEAVEAAKEMRDKINVLLFLDTIRHVYRSGRIPRIASQAGSILNIRPLLTVYKTVNFVGVVRSRERGIEKLLNFMRNRAGQQPVHLAVMHAYALDEAEKLKERISSEFDCREMWLSEFSPVMGYATGTGTLGVAFYSGD